MLPATLTLARYFYPVGDTPPQDLVGFLPPSEDAKILSLGCGDLRNLLFTVYSDSVVSIGSSKDPLTRELDFTCCDDESAIIARNLLVLFAILKDESSANNHLIWEIYYHIFLTPAALDFLRTTAKELLEQTKSLDEWHKHTLGSRLRFVSQDTHYQVRRFWEFYISAGLPTKEKIQENMKDSSELFYSDIDHQTPMRSAIPFFSKAMDIATLTPNLGYFHTNYWNYGVVFGKGKSATSCNPSMIFSDVRGSKFALHFRTNPLLAFNVAPALVALDPTDPLYIPGFEDRAYNPTVRLPLRIAVCMRKQFKLWSTTFRADFDKVHVRFMVGEALAVCSALELVEKSIPSSYTRQWTSHPMVLDGGDYDRESPTAPWRFTVIDTSTLGDNLGLLNILVAVLPLLLNDPSSTLYTERLDIPDEESLGGQTLESQLFGDQKTMFLLLGITPIAQLFEHSDRSPALDYFCKKYDWGRRGFLWHRIPWKRPTLGENKMDSISIEPTGPLTFPLANFLYEMYVLMFHDESDFLDPIHIVRYTRASFAKFILFLQSRIDTDWTRTMLSLVSLITLDTMPNADERLRWGHYGMKELFVQLHLHGLYTHNCLVKSSDTWNSMALSSYPGALGEADTGEMVYINVVIPRSNAQEMRKKLLSFDPDNPQRLGLPNIRAGISRFKGGGNHEPFEQISCLHMCFGNVVSYPEGKGPTEEIVIEEDELGFQGASDLVVWLGVCTSILRLYAHPQDIVVTLQCHPSPGTCGLTHPWKDDLMLFAQNLYSESIFITANPPNLSLTAIQESNIRYPDEFELNGEEDGIKFEGPFAVFDQDSRTIGQFMWRLKWATGTRLEHSGRDMQIQQNSACGITVSYEDRQVNLKCPYPVDASTAISMLRVVDIVEDESGTTGISAEVTVLPFSPSRDNDSSDNPTSKTISKNMDLPRLQCYSAHPLSMIVSKNKDPILVSIHSIKIDKLPIYHQPMGFPPSTHYHWEKLHTAMMDFSREKKLMVASKSEKEFQTGPSTLKLILISIYNYTTIHNIDLGTSIYSIDDSDGYARFIIIPSAWRIDMAAQTLFLDVHVICAKLIGRETTEKITKDIHFPSPGFVSSECGLELWGEYLAACIERCRGGIWEHDPDTCAYRNSELTTSSELGEICTCGMSKVSAQFASIKKFEEMAPFCHRAAIDLIFPSSLFERLSLDWN